MQSACQKVSEIFLVVEKCATQTQKHVFFELWKWLIGVPFLKKWRFHAFPSIKTDSCVEGCSNYHQQIPLVFRNLKHMHLVFIWGLDPLEKTFGGATCIFKKSFFDSHFPPKSLIKVLDFEKHEFFKKRHSENGLTHLQTLKATLLNT